MKTPEEIKKFLLHCAGGGACIECHYDGRDFPHCIARLLDDALALIQQLEAQGTKWISVAERLPEANAFVLMYTRGWMAEGIYNEVTGFEYYDKESKPWAWKKVDEIITHWMPLPEPPKEENHAQAD